VSFLVMDAAWGESDYPAHRPHMEAALAEALRAAQEEEVPVGAVIYSLERSAIIASAHNLREQRQDPTAHAEMLALQQAAQVIGSWRLERCVLYVTLEPCPMCAGAIVQARVPIVVYGTTDPKGGACHTLYTITNDLRLNHRCLVIGGILAEPAGQILSEFFARKRRKQSSSA